MPEVTQSDAEQQDLVIALTLPQLTLLLLGITLVIAWLRRALRPVSAKTSPESHG